MWAHLSASRFSHESFQHVDYRAQFTECQSMASAGPLRLMETSWLGMQRIPYGTSAPRSLIQVSRMHMIIACVLEIRKAKFDRFPRTVSASETATAERSRRRSRTDPQIASEQQGNSK